MRVSVQETREMMRKALSVRGYTAEETDFVVEMYLGGELRGHASHGLANFPIFLEKNRDALPEPSVIKETDALYMVEANSGLGTLIGKIAADEAMARAQKQVVGVALIKDMESWLRPGAIAQYIAEKGYLAIVVNDGGGTSMAPPGGYDPTLGTNPIAYGIPTADAPLVVDMATSKRAWGQVRLANKYGTDLPKDTFYNDKGQITLNPNEAHSVLPFGDHKGFALALLIEVLCGSLLGKGMMVASNTGSQFGAKFPDRGGVVIAFDPAQTVGLDDFKADNSSMLERIKATRNLEGQTIRVPGEQAGALQQEAIKSDSLDIPEELWQELKSIGR